MYKPFILISFISVFLLLLQSELYAQGCSDAGICSIENIKPGNIDPQEGNQLKVGIGYGNADQGIAIISPYITYTRTFNNFSFETRLLAISQSGNETSSFGLSDLYLVGNYRIAQNLQATAGFKIPLSNANKKLNGLPLPMDYQSSLGTVDLLLGAQYTVSGFMFAFAYQQPLSQNSNTFLVDDYPSDSDFNKFQSTNNYVRKGDVLLRVSRSIPFGEKVTITPSLLPIYHLGNDRYTDLFSEEQEIIGSEGLTLNVNLYADFAVGSKSNIQLNFGSPLIVRESRPDGLTRSFVLNLEYQISF
jgi:hypothetical protein